MLHLEHLQSNHNQIHKLGRFLRQRYGIHIETDLFSDASFRSLNQRNVLFQFICKESCVTVQMATQHKFNCFTSVYLMIERGISVQVSASK